VTRPSGGLTIVATGYIVRGPLAGPTWQHLQYVRGLLDLGHSVYFLEDSDDYAGCYDPVRDVIDNDPTYGLAYAARVFERVGCAEHWAYHDAHAGRWHGPRGADIVARCRDADVLVNVSGINPLRSWTREIPVRILVDTDPVFTQIRHLTDPAAMASARAHTAFFTFGENFGRPGCTMPDDGLPWLATRQPVVLDLWPVTPPPATGRYTTVMLWDSYRSREYAGIRYGMKSASFPPFIEFPRRIRPQLEVAIGGAGAPRAELEATGWTVANSLDMTRDPWTYQAYLQASRGEFGLAKEGYVKSGCGWFSERSLSYLASARPVIVHDTGFTHWLSTTHGVIAFRDVEDACTAVAEVEANYGAHCAAAREVVQSHFAADRVLASLLDRAFARPASHATGVAQHMTAVRT